VEDIKITRLEWAGHNKDGRRKDSKKASKRKLLYHLWYRSFRVEDQEVDGRMYFRGMHYNCWGYEDGGEEQRIEMNGGVL
jgi:hypothetical protein